MTTIRLPEPTDFADPKTKGFLSELVRGLTIYLTDTDRELGRATANKGSVTLTAGATSTVVNDLACTAKSVVHLTAYTSDAALEISGGTLYCVPNTQFFTVYHANDVSTNRIFKYTLVK